MIEHSQRRCPRRGRSAAGAAALLAIGVSLVAAPEASPQRVNSAVMSVGVNVRQSCAITVSDLQFGNYDPLVAHATAPLDVETTMTTICTPDTLLLIEMDDGQNPGGGGRALSFSSERLTYDIFQNPGRTQRWGRANEGLMTTTPPGQLAPMFLTVYGRIGGGQNVSAGTYSDAVQVTLHF